MNSVLINKTPTQSITDIKQHVTEYYKGVLGTSGTKYASLSDHFLEEADKVTPHENTILEDPFTLEEIKHALFNMKPNGVTGPDGFSFKFYQFF